jgi:hypothetical protein
MSKPALSPGKPLLPWLAILASALLLTGCGGGAATATPLPPEVARPVQPTPVYANAAGFRLATTETPAVMATPPVIESSPDLGRSPPISSSLPVTAFAPLPSALGIATGGAALWDQPDGAVIATLPAGEIVTVTGKGADGRFVAVYTNAFAVGWVATDSLTLYGADDLTVVNQALEPAPVATLMAEAMATVQVLDEAVATPTP